MICEEIFKTPSLSFHKSQEAEILREDSPPPPVTCHVLCVTCHMSPLFFFVLFSFFSSFFRQIGEASCWRICYQLGLPSLGYIYLLGKDKRVFSSSPIYPYCCNHLLLIYPSDISFIYARLNIFLEKYKVLLSFYRFDRTNSFSLFPPQIQR